MPPKHNPAPVLLLAALAGLLACVVLVPSAQAAPPALSTTLLAFSDRQGDGVASPARSVTLTNPGPQSISLGTPTLDGGGASFFTIISAGGLPRTLEAGQSVAVSVAFNAPAGSFAPPTSPVKQALLQIPVDASPLSIQLQGLVFVGDGDFEPSLQHVLQTFGYDVDVADPDPFTNRLGRALLPQGDEIPAQRFRKADPAKPVTVETLAVFGPNKDDTTVRFGWYESLANPQELFLINKANKATVSPVVTGTTSFNPGTASFGTYSHWPFFEGSGQYTASSASASDDSLNTWEPTRLFRHKVRVYPAKRLGGTVEANSYIVAHEEQTAGQDYQDIVVVLRNVVPVTPDLALDFGRVYPGTLFDKDGQTIGFITTQRRTDTVGNANTTAAPDTISTTTSFNPALLDIDSGAGTLAISTTRTSSAGRTSEGWNSLVNALELPIPQGSEPFTVSTRLLGPLSNLTANSQQAGLFVGTDQDTFLKLIVLRLNGENIVQFYRETAGGNSQSFTAPLADLASITALDLTVRVDPTTSRPAPRSASHGASAQRL